MPITVSDLGGNYTIKCGTSESHIAMIINPCLQEIDFSFSRRNTCTCLHFFECFFSLDFHLENLGIDEPMTHFRISILCPNQYLEEYTFFRSIIRTLKREFQLQFIQKQNLPFKLISYSV